VTYVGSAENQAHDQELDCVLLPADTPGRFKFVLEVRALVRLSLTFLKVSGISFAESRLVIDETRSILRNPS